MSKIHIAQVHEVESLVEMGEMFHTQAYPPALETKFNPTHFIKTWKQLIASGAGRIFIARDSGGAAAGVIGGLQYQDTNTGDVMVHEAFWFVHPTQRGGFLAMRLYREFITWAKMIGAKTVIMVHLIGANGEQLSSLYRKLGFTEVEVNYMKRI